MSADWSPVSTREVRSGLDPSVLTAGPPPVPRLAAPWAVRVADPDAGDAALVSEWMNRPHVDRFWEQAWPVGRWVAVLRHQLAGDCTRPLIAARDGVDLAYLEVYRTPRDVVGRHYAAGPHDLGLHIAIGEPSATRRGLGRELVRSIVDGLAAADPRCERVLADPDAAHQGARRMFGAAGFTLIGERDLGHKTAALYRHEIVRLA